jgi:glutathione S-transferase
MPVLVDGDRTIVEASIIVEYLDQQHRAGTRLLPVDPGVALDVRMLDRFFDNYVATPMQRIVFNAIRAPEHRDHHGVDGRRAGCSTISYGWLDATLERPDRLRGAGVRLDEISGGAPALFYARLGTSDGQRARTSRGLSAPGGRDCRSRARVWTRLGPARCSRSARWIVTDPAPLRFCFPAKLAGSTERLTLGKSEVAA